MIKSDADKKVIDGFENDIKTLARTTAFVVKGGAMTREEAYEFLNEKGNEYSKKYESMSAVELILDLAADAVSIIGETKNVQD